MNYRILRNPGYIVVVATLGKNRVHRVLTSYQLYLRKIYLQIRIPLACSFPTICNNPPWLTIRTNRLSKLLALRRATVVARVSTMSAVEVYWPWTLLFASAPSKFSPVSDRVCCDHDHFHPELNFFSRLQIHKKKKLLLVSIGLLMVLIGALLVSCLAIVFLTRSNTMVELHR